MSWDDEKRTKHLLDMERVFKGEIDYETKEEIKISPLKDLKNLKWDRSKFRHFTRVIPREEWGAIPSSEPLPPLVTPILKIHYSFHRNWPTCHTREECEQTVRMMQLREMNERGLPDVRHNFMVGNDCNVYEGRGWLYWAEQPWDVNPKEWNQQSLDIGFFGEKLESWPWEEMFEVTKELIATWIKYKLVDEKYERI